MNCPAPQQVIAILGPTGSGKSSVAMELAQELNGEIISCDSVQVYRSFDVGSAKASAAERQRVPHHLIDVVAWQEKYDAQRFREEAAQHIAKIQTKGRVPVICGGTGLYFRVLRWGVIDVPPSEANFRERWEHQEREEPGSVIEKLLEVDPDSAAHIAKNNVRQQIRALEIFASTGKMASVLKREHGFRAEEVPMRAFWLEWPTDTLRARIRSRVDLMLDAGLLAEVQSLLDAGIQEDCQAMRAVGYAQCVQCLRGELKEAQLAEHIWKSTWAYARRQRTWLRREKKLQKIQVESLLQAQGEILSLLKT